MSAPSLQRQNSRDTINAATMRLCPIDPPAVAHSVAAALSAKLRVPSLSREKPLPQRSSPQSLQPEEKEGHIRGRCRRFVHNPR